MRYEFSKMAGHRTAIVCHQDTIRRGCSPKNLRVRYAYNTTFAGVLKSIAGSLRRKPMTILRLKSASA